MILKLYRTFASKLINFKSTQELNDHIQLHCHATSKKLNKNTKAALDLICKHSVKYKGVSWLNDETIASTLNVHVRTIKRAIQRLIDLNIVRIETVEINGLTLRYFVILPFKLDEECQEIVQELSNSESGETSIETSYKLNLGRTESIETKEAMDIDIKDRNNVKGATKHLPLDHSYIPSNVPDSFISACKPFFSAYDTYKLYTRATIAHVKANLSMSMENYSETLIEAFKATIWAVKTSDVRDMFGYFYRTVENMLIIEKRREVGTTMYNWLEFDPGTDVRP
jgi:DNA-binding Lrp family transcriptional regulator